VHRLTNENSSDAIEWFGEMAVALIKKLKIVGPFAIIPVPNSSSLIDSASKPRTRKLAKAIVDRLSDGGIVLDCLRFKVNLGSASTEDGPRETEKIYKNDSVDVVSCPKSNSGVWQHDRRSFGHQKLDATKQRH
jgi:hypothetical protein